MMDRAVCSILDNNQLFFFFMHDQYEAQLCYAAQDYLNSSIEPRQSIALPTTS